MVSKLTIKKVSCSQAMECIDYFSNALTLPGGDRITKEGMISRVNPLAVDYQLSYLGKNCKHPQKKEIITYIASLPIIDNILTPHSILKKITDLGRALESGYKYRKRHR